MKSLFLTISALCAAAVCGTASAATYSQANYVRADAQPKVEGFYAGIDWNSTESKSVFSSARSRRHSAFSIKGGYQFNPYFAVEGQYMSLAYAQANAWVPVRGLWGATLAPAHISANAGVFSGSAVGILPLNEHFELFGKVGMSVLSAALTVRPYNFLYPAYQDHAHKWMAHYGVGAKLKFSPSVAAVIAYTRYDSVKEVYFMNHNAVSLGLEYKF